jgi:hypothetical protein
MDTTESSASFANAHHPPRIPTTPQRRATLLSSACAPACINGWVFVGYIDEHGEEQQAVYVCRRCQQQQSEEESR